MEDFGLTKGIVYYTDNNGDQNLYDIVRKQIDHARGNIPVISVSLKPLAFGKNIVVDAKRGNLTMFKQVLIGLESIETDIVFLCEHDVLYHPSHFDYVPPENSYFFYNENVWRLQAGTGQALFYYARSTSCLCAYRDLLIRHYCKRVSYIEKNGFQRKKIGYEPGRRGLDAHRTKTYWSSHPNVDIRNHGHNLTESRFTREEFRNPDTIRGWTLSDEIPAWGKTKGRYEAFLKDVEKGTVP